MIAADKVTSFKNTSAWFVLKNKPKWKVLAEDEKKLSECMIEVDEEEAINLGNDNLYDMFDNNPIPLPTMK